MKTRGNRRLLSLLLVLSLLLGMLPVAALATDEIGHQHGQVGFSDDGNYYACDFVEGSTVTAETADQCITPEEHLTDDLHTADCFSVATVESSGSCNAYPYFTVTFEDPNAGNERVQARMVPGAPEYSESAPVFTDASGAQFQGWFDVDGNAVDFAALAGDVTVYALWSAAAQTMDAVDMNIPLETKTFEIVGAQSYSERGSNLGRQANVTVTAMPGERITRDMLGVPAVTEGNWDFLYNGRVEVETTLGVWRSVDFFTLDSNGKLIAHYGDGGDSSVRVHIGSDWEGIPMLSLWSGDLCFYYDWPFSFFDMASNGVEYAYSVDGQTIHELGTGESLYLFNNQDAFNRVSGNNDALKLEMFSKDQGVMFFVKASEGNKPVNGVFSQVAGEQAGVISTLSASNEKKSFGAALDAADAQGYTHEFHYTQFKSGWNDDQGRRGFQINTEADTTAYTVSYLPGEAGQNAIGTTAAQSGTWNSQITISDCGFQWAGHAFTGWTVENGTKTYQPGDAYYVKGENLVLVANWKTVVTYPMELNYTYDNNGNGAPVPADVLTATLAGKTLPSGVSATVSDGLIQLEIADSAVQQGNGNQITFNYGAFVLDPLSNGSTLINGGQHETPVFQLGKQNTKGPQLIYTEKDDPKPEEKIALTVEHWMGVARDYDHMSKLDQNLGKLLPANSTADSVQALADQYIIPTADTLGDGPEKDYSYLFKRAEASQNEDGSWVLRLKYTVVKFYITVSKIPTESPGASWTPAITGVLKDAPGNPEDKDFITLDAKDYTDTTNQGRQYEGNRKVIETDVAKFISTVNNEKLVSALKAKGVNFNAETQSVLWYTVHEGNFVHVDGVVVDNPKKITYHANFPGSAETHEIALTKGEGAIPSHDVLSYAATQMAVPANAAFLGWSTTPDGAVMYAPGSVIEVARDADLYAKWQNDYTVTYSIEGPAPTTFTGTIPGMLPTAKPGQPMSVAGNLASIQNSNNEKTIPGSWAFNGWKSQDVTIDKNNQYQMPNQNVSFVGTWTFKPDTVMFYIRNDGKIQEEVTSSTELKKHSTTFYTQAGSASFSTELGSKIVAGDGASYISLRASDFNADQSGSFTAAAFDNLKFTVTDKQFSDYTWYVVKDSDNNGMWHVDGINNNYLTNYTVTYQPGGHGSFTDVVNSGLGYGTTTPAFTGSLVSKDNGFTFNGWMPNVSPDVTGNATYVAQWKETTQYDYTVEFYYQDKDGKYADSTTNVSVRSEAKYGDVSITEADKIPSDAKLYVLDTAKTADWTGTTAPEKPVVLKVYFKQQFSVTYQPGDFGTFAQQSYSGLSYGDKTPAFVGQTPGNGYYVFIGWSPAVSENVTGVATYVAQWRFVGSSDPTPNPPTNNPTTDIPETNVPLGPGDELAEITEPDVPMAEAPAEDGMVIVDENVPLGDLPMTGTQNPSRECDPTMTLGFLALMASLTAAGLAFLLTRKREEEEV